MQIVKKREMKMMTIIVVALAVLVMGCFNTNVTKAASLKSKLISKVSADLEISKGVATVKVAAESKQAKIIKMNVKASLQKYSGGKWSTVKSWSATTSNKKLLMSGKYTIPKGGVIKNAYRTKGEIKAVKGNSSETVVVYSKTIYAK